MNFKIVDLLIGTFSGTLIAFAVTQVIPAHGNMFFGMIAGGVVGMTLMFPLLIVLIPFFGAFEVMIPLSIISMVTGMSSGMGSVLGAAPAGCIGAAGAISGCAVASLVQQSNRKLSRTL